MSTLLHVLVVEDSEEDTSLLEFALKCSGFEPKMERVTNAAALRKALARQNWDVVVSDSSLPGFNALSALAVVRQSGQDIPFFIVSGAIAAEDAAAALKAGAQGCIVKDRLDELAPAIERQLRKADARRQQRAC